MKMRMQWILLLGVAALGLGVLGALADEPAKADGPTLTVTDGGGKEHKLKTWKFTNGTRHLAWLAPAEKEADPKDKPEPKDKAQPKAPQAKAAVGPEALEFREEESTPFKVGILTFVPMDRLRALEYDNTKMTVTLTAATGPKPEDTTSLTGLTKFVGSNKITIEAEVDKGDLGIAEIKFLGGVPKGINSLKITSAAKIEAQPEGRVAYVTTAALEGKDKVTHEVHELQALYRVGGGETLSPLLFFKKTLKIDVAKISKITVATTGADSAWGLTMKAGGEESLSLLTTPMLDGKPAVLEGFLGRVPAGYKLFPVSVVEEVQFDEKPKKFDASKPGQRLRSPLAE